MHALYVSTTASQVYYENRIGGTWSTRLAVEQGTSDNPTLMVRAPNDATYGYEPGGMYWKSSTSETYFYSIPEFELIFLPILVVLLFGLFRRRSQRRTDNHPAN